MVKRGLLKLFDKRLSPASGIPSRESGVAREVAMLDGNLLFHEPMRYVKQSRKALDEALTALPVGLGAIALAAEAFLKSEEVRARGPKGLPQD